MTDTRVTRDNIVDSAESTVWDFSPEQRPANFYNIMSKLTGGKASVLGNIVGYQPDCARTVEGFEDILGARLGAGIWYNTGTAVDQLVMALSLSTEPAIEEITCDKGLRDTVSVVRKLREAEVLQGMKIVDLGCGLLPGFALASRSLGAEVFTVDGVNIEDNFKDILNGHAVADLAQPETAATLLEMTGGNCDLLSENIIGNVHDMPRFNIPTPMQIQDIARTLLKNGGYIDSKITMPPLEQARLFRKTTRAAST